MTEKYIRQANLNSRQANLKMSIETDVWQNGNSIKRQTCAFFLEFRLMYYELIDLRVKNKIKIHKIEKTF